MGTTLTAILFAGTRLGLVHIGDSRGYLLRDGELTQITKDDTFVQSLVDEGRITAEEAHTPPAALAAPARAHRAGRRARPDRCARPGPATATCSAPTACPAWSATRRSPRRCSTYRDPRECADRLIELALRGGGPDNVTCIVADVVDVDFGDDAPIVGGVGRRRPRRSARRPTPRPARASATTMTRAAAAHRARRPPAAGARRTRPRLRDSPRSVAVARSCSPAAGVLARLWVMQQYFVGVDGDQVAIFQGVRGERARRCRCTTSSSSTDIAARPTCTEADPQHAVPRRHHRRRRPTPSGLAGAARPAAADCCAAPCSPPCPVRPRRAAGARRRRPHRAARRPRRRPPTRTRPPRRPDRRPPSPTTARVRRRRPSTGRDLPGGLSDRRPDDGSAGRAADRDAGRSPLPTGAASSWCCWRSPRCSSPSRCVLVEANQEHGAAPGRCSTSALAYLALFAVRAPRRARLRAVRRPAAAAVRRAAQRPRPGDDPPARPRRRERAAALRPRGAHVPTSEMLWTALGVALFVAVLVLRARPPHAARYAYTAGFAGLVLLALPGAAAVVDLRGQRREDLDPAGRLLDPARRVRQDPAGHLLRRVPGAEARRCSPRPGSTVPRHGPAARPRPRRRSSWPGCSSIGVLVFENDLGTSLLFFGIVLVMLYVATERVSAGWSSALAAVRRRRRSRPTSSSATSRCACRSGWTRSPTSTAPATSSVQALFGLGTGGIVGTGLGSGPPGPRARRRDRLHLAALGEELGLVGLAAILVLYLIADHPRAAHRARRARQLRQAARRRPGVRAGAPGVHRRRRRHQADPADRPDHAVPVLRRLVAGGQLRAARAPAADLRRRPPRRCRTARRAAARRSPTAGTEVVEQRSEHPAPPHRRRRAWC